MAEEPSERSSTISDEYLLKLVKEERANALGFEQTSQLTEDRERALNYKKGDMGKDVPYLENRSKAVSTDVADAIRTVLPDLVEIFTGGDDVATFQPHSQEDEKSAREETDYINHVINHQNSGFMNYYSAIDDALTVKTGIFKWWWEQTDEESEEAFEDLDAEAFTRTVEAAQQSGAQLEDVQSTDGEYGATYSGRVVYPAKGKVCIGTVPPEDFCAARDTVLLPEATYCSMRSRPRAQDLIADGYDPELVDSLSEYTQPGDAEPLARDTVGENNQSTSSSQELRTVEIVEHFIRIVEDGEARIWRVVTGNDEGVLLEREEVGQIQFSAMTPYPVAHRFYGQSLADLLLEIQRIRTALMRMLLDSGYFALNQRSEINMRQANEWTIQDFLNPVPGGFVRSEGEAIKPIMSGGLGFDATGALEYFATVAESRTGVVRNAQGLNPDTLHDTAKGAMVLMNSAQRRTRMVARILAETGIKDLFLGVHALLRRHGVIGPPVQVKGQWITVDPSQWNERLGLEVDIGVGSGGREFAMQQGMAAVGIMEKFIQLQGGPQGPIVTLQNAYELGRRLYEKALGFKSADPYLSDPSKAQQQPGGPPQPDPEMLKLQAEQQQAAAKMAQDQQQAQAKLESEERIAMAKIAAEQESKRYQIDAELRVKAASVMVDAQQAQHQNALQAAAVHFGGEPG